MNLNLEVWIAILLIVCGCLMSSGKVSAFEAQTSVARIVGGENVATNYPWMVSIQPLGGNENLCGGTLVGPRSVLTAAHCTELSLSSRPLQVFLGANNLDVEDQGVIVPVSFINTHPQYKANFLINDVALLTLDSAVDQAPVTIADRMVTANFSVGDNALILGWGATAVEFRIGSAIDYVYPRDLQQAMVPIQDRTTCQATYNNTGFAITDSMFCASQFEPPRDACSGDSGGPLLVYESGFWQQVGLVSFGSQLCDPGELPGVYTDVTQFDSFIEQAIKGPVVAVDFGTERVGEDIIESVDLTADFAFSVSTVLNQDPMITSVDYSDCQRNISADQSCELILILANPLPGHVDTSITLGIDNNETAENSEMAVNVFGWVLEAFPAASNAIELEGIAGLEWFTGGDAPWVVSTAQANTGDSSVKAGQVNTAEESILMAYGGGPTLIRFLNRLMNADNNMGNFTVSAFQNGQSLGSEAVQTMDQWVCSSREALDDTAFKIVWRYTGLQMPDNNLSDAGAYVDSVGSGACIGGGLGSQGSGGTMGRCLLICLVVVAVCGRFRYWKCLVKYK